MFAGGFDSMKDSAKKTMQLVGGILIKKATATLMETVLGSIGLTAGATGILGWLAYPALNAIGTALMNAILTPLLSSLTSFAGGGQINSPTGIIVGDNPNSPEWIFRNFDILALLDLAITKALAKQKTEQIDNRLNIVNFQPVQLESISAYLIVDSLNRNTQLLIVNMNNKLDEVISAIDMKPVLSGTDIGKNANIYNRQQVKKSVNYLQ
jgi:hypothetical protein